MPCPLPKLAPPTWEQGVWGDYQLPTSSAWPSPPPHPGGASVSPARALLSELSPTSALIPPSQDSGTESFLTGEP